MTFPILKGHGTRNDFVLLPDLDGDLHAELSADTVRALCDRRAGIGADGVLRIVRGDVDGSRGGADWFMDYRNADGGIVEMCGNGIRVVGRYLAERGLADTSRPLAIGTRDGLKLLRFDADGEIGVDMGVPRPGAGLEVVVDGRTVPATFVDIGNPHAVAFVSSLDEAGSLRDEPGFDHEAFPDGLNVEFVVRHGQAQLAMRVYERGVGETQSCGTGACAAVAAAEAAGPRGVPVSVDVPGGRLTVTWADDGHIELKGPAVIVAEGVWRD